MEAVFFDIGLIIILATLVGYIVRILKQPVIPAYILTGLVIGPFGLGLVTDLEIIKTLGEIGVAFLLFIVGLEIDITRLKDVGFVASMSGIAKSIILVGFGFLAANYFGFFSQTDSFYIGLVLAFSSTMVVVKMLSDKKDLDSLHGKIVVGILLVEDILAIITISVISSLGGDIGLMLLNSFLKILLIFAVTFALSKYVFPQMFRFAAKSGEMLFMLSVAMCLFFSILISTLGFSIAIGAFVAGIGLANLPYSFEIIGRVKPLRDFFATVFFVTLGMELVPSSLDYLFMPIVVFFLLVVIFKSGVIIVMLKFFGYKIRTSFLTATALAQTSEFSLIIVAQGMALGHVTQDVFTIAVLLSILTISVSTYMIEYNHKLYHAFSGRLGILDKIFKPKKEKAVKKRKKYDIILIGCSRIGFSIIETLRKIKRTHIMIDYDPDVIKKLAKKKIPCIFGDIADPEIIRRLDLKNAKLVISTIPGLHDNSFLIKKIKAVKSQANILVTANRVEEALELYELGADYVILPHFLGGQHVSMLIEKANENVKKLINTKISHIKELKNKVNIYHY